MWPVTVYGRNPCSGKDHGAGVGTNRTLAPFMCLPEPQPLEGRAEVIQLLPRSATVRVLMNASQQDATNFSSKTHTSFCERVR